MKVIFKKMTKARQKQRKFDDDVTHVLNNVVTNHSDMTAAFKSAGVYTLIDLLNKLKTEDSRKKFRYKDGDDTKEEILDDDDYDELCELRSLYFWLQNSHGSLPGCPIDFRARYTKDMLTAFRVLPSSARTGADQQGNVEYDHNIALGNEKINKIGAFAPIPPSANGGGLSNGGGNGGGNNSNFSGTQSNEEKELAAFTKRIKASDQSFPDLKSTSGWNKFKSIMIARLTLCKMGDIVQDGYVVPSSSRGDHQDAVDLYDTKNLYLYTLLCEHVSTPAGEGFIRDHPNDGVAIWKKLINHYEKEQPATLRKDTLYELFATSTLPKDCPEVHKACLTFMDTVENHNKLCTDPDERVKDKMKLRHFEKFIRTYPALKDVKTTLDSADKIAITNGHAPMSAQARMEFYLENAIRIDGERKERLIKSTRGAHLVNGQHSIDEILDMDLTAARAALEATSFGGYETYFMYGDHLDIDEQMDAVDATYEAFVAGREGEAGFLPPDVWNGMSKVQKQGWLKLGRELRERFYPAGHTLPSTQDKGHVLPGTGVASHRSRATNASIGSPTPHNQDSQPPTMQTPGPDDNRSVSFAGTSDSTIIEAMRANSTREPTGGLHSSRRNMNVKNPLDPTRLLSSQNASDTQIRPLPRNNAAHRAVSAPLTERTVASAMRTAAFPEIQLSGDSSTNSSSTDTSTRSAFVAISIGSHRRRFNLPAWLSLIDGGANVGLAHPNQLRRIDYAYPPRSVDINGVDGTGTLEGLRVGSFAGVSRYKNGDEVLLIFHEYGELPRASPSSTIHSKIQIEHGGHRVMDRPHRLGGEQCITLIPNGEDVPLFFHSGLAYMQTRRPTDYEMNTLPRVTVTSDTPWEPGIYNGMPRIHRRWEPVGSDNGAEYLFNRRVENSDDDSSDDDMPPLVYPDDNSRNDDTSSDGSETNNAITMGDDHDNDSVPGEQDQPLIVRGHLVPRSLNEALQFDRENGDSAWKDAVERELHVLFRGNMARFLFYPHSLSGGPPLLSLAWNFGHKEDGTKKVRLVSHHDRRVVSLSHPTGHDQLYLGVMDSDTNRAFNGSTHAAIPLMGSRESPLLSIADPHQLVEGRPVDHHLFEHQLQQLNPGMVGQPRTPNENGRNESFMQRSRPRVHREVNHAAAYTAYVDNRSVYDRMIRLVDSGANVGVRPDRAQPEMSEETRKHLRQIVQTNVDSDRLPLEDGWNLI